MIALYILSPAFKIVENGGLGLLVISLAFQGLSSCPALGEVEEADVKPTVSSAKKEVTLESQESQEGGSDTGDTDTRLWPTPVPQRVSAVRYSEARSLMEKGKWSEAAVVLRTLYSENDKFTPAAFDLATALVFQGERGSALELLDELGRKSNRSVRRALLRRSKVISKVFVTSKTYDLYQRGVVLLKDGQYRIAGKYFTKAVAREGSNVGVLLRAGQTYLMDDNVDRAIELLNRAKVLNSTEGSVHIWLGRCYYRKGDIKASVQAFHEGLKYFPNSELAPVWLSESFVALGQRKKAEAALQLDLEQYPLHVQSLVALSGIRSRLWDSRKDLQIAVSRLDDYSKKRTSLFSNDVSFDPAKINDVHDRAKRELAQVDKKIESISND